MRGFSNWVNKSFGRVISTGKLIPVVDGLRFVAIAAVILHHLNGFVTKRTAEWATAPRDFSLFHVLHLGNCGVPLFFALSGFILGMPFLEKIQAKQSFSLRNYYLRRVTRLEPPFVINLLLITVLLIVVKGQAIGDIVLHLLASLVYLHGLIYEQWSTINGVSWSLEIEVQFYLIAPFLAVLIYQGTPRFRRCLIVSLIVLTIGMKYFWTGHLPKRVLLSLPYYLDFFLTGMLLADFYATDWKRAA